MSFGRRLGHGDHVHGAQEPPQSGLLVIVPVGEEAHEALHAGADQEPVDEGEVVADEERRPALGHVLAPHQADAEGRVGEQPDGEADEEAGQAVEGVGRAREGAEPHEQHDVVGLDPEHAAQQPEGARRHEDAHHVHEVVGGDEAAARRGAGLVLEEGVQGHDEETAREAEEGEGRRGRGERGGCEGQQERAHGQAEAAQRHQAELDLLAREPPRRQAADGDTDAQGGLEQAGARVVEAHDLLAEEDRVQLQERAQEPEDSDAGHGEGKPARAPHLAEPARDLGEGREGERLPRNRPRHARDPEAGRDAERRDGDEEEADPDEAIRPDREDEPARRRAQDDGEEGRHLAEAVGARELPLREDLGQDAVLGRAEEGRLGRHQEEDGQKRLDTARQEGERAQAHDGDLARLDGDEHAALGEGVREVPGIAREEEVGQDEEGAGQGQIAAAPVPPRAQLHGQQRDHDLEQVVVEGAQELRRQLGAKALDAQQGAVACPRHVSLLACSHCAGRRAARARASSRPSGRGVPGRTCASRSPTTTADSGRWRAGCPPPGRGPPRLVPTFIIPCSIRSLFPSPR